VSVFLIKKVLVRRSGAYRHKNALVVITKYHWFT